MKQIFVVFSQEVNGKYFAVADTIRTGENLIHIAADIILISAICAKTENKLNKSRMNGTNHINVMGRI